MKNNSIITNTKINLIREGVRFEPLSLFTNYPKINLFKTKRLKTNPTRIGNEVYDLTNEFNLLPAEIIIERDNNKSIVKLRYNEKSDYILRLNEKKLVELWYMEKKVDIDIFLVKIYQILEEQTPLIINNHRTKVGDFVDIVGIDRISILLFEGCNNWNCGKACKFCDLHPKMKQDKVIRPTTNDLHKYETVKSWWNETKQLYLEGIKYSLNRILKEISFPHKHLFIMAGNLPTNRDVWEIAEEVIYDMSKYLDLNQFDSYLNISPHDNILRLKKVKKLGIKNVQYNLEIANKSLFEYTCPGKMNYDIFVGKLKEAITVFGKGNVRSNFIFGLQNKDEMLEELENLAKYGIVADYSIFQPKRKTEYSNKISPSFEDVLYFNNKLVEMYLKYKFKPIFCTLSSRSSIVNEVYNDRKANI